MSLVETNGIEAAIQSDQSNRALLAQKWRDEALKKLKMQAPLPANHFCNHQVIEIHIPALDHSETECLGCVESVREIVYEPSIEIPEGQFFYWQIDGEMQELAATKENLKKILPPEMLQGENKPKPNPPQPTEHWVVREKDSHKVRLQNLTEDGLLLMLPGMKNKQNFYMESHGRKCSIEEFLASEEIVTT